MAYRSNPNSRDFMDRIVNLTVSVHKITRIFKCFRHKFITYTLVILTKQNFYHKRSHRWRVLFTEYKCSFWITRCNLCLHGIFSQTRHKYSSIIVVSRLKNAIMYTNLLNIFKLISNINGLWLDIMVNFMSSMIHHLLLLVSILFYLMSANYHYSWCVEAPLVLCVTRVWLWGCNCL